MRKCSFEGCAKPRSAKGLCSGHYNQSIAGKQLKPLRRRSSPNSTREDILNTWLDKSGDCWIWSGDTWSGYGKTAYQGKRFYAHRMAYEVWVGAITPGDVVHHKCANGLCCNPEHLQLTTHHDNVAEMFARRTYEARIAELEAELADLRTQLASTTTTAKG